MVLILAGGVKLLWSADASHQQLLLSLEDPLSSGREARTKVTNSLVSGGSILPWTVEWTVALVWCLAGNYTSKQPFPSPTLSKLYGSLPCPHFQFDNPTLV